MHTVNALFTILAASSKHPVFPSSSAFIAIVLKYLHAVYITGRVQCGQLAFWYPLTTANMVSFWPSYALAQAPGSSSRSSVYATFHSPINASTQAGRDFAGSCESSYSMSRRTFAWFVEKAKEDISALRGEKTAPRAWPFCVLRARRNCLLWWG